MGYADAYMSSWIPDEAFNRKLELPAPVSSLTWVLKRGL